jgi:hypothetical protein
MVKMTLRDEVRVRTTGFSTSPLRRPEKGGGEGSDLRETERENSGRCSKLYKKKLHEIFTKYY